MNNRGFGFLGFLFILCFLGICIYISVFYFQTLMKTNITETYYTVSRGGTGTMGNDYSGIVNDSTNEYHKLEYELEKYAKDYVNQNSITSENKIVISLKIMQEKKIVGPIYDSKQSLCNGYVIYDSKLMHYTPYLKCGNYRSVDYVNQLE